MPKIIKLKISGMEFTANEGSTILDLARANSIFIPTLCNFKGLSNVGACRLCMIEIRGVPRLLPACATLVAEGMDVTVDSPKVTKYRKMILELLFAERNHVCAVCVSNGHCELQSLAQQLGVNHTRYPYRYPIYKYDASHPKFNYDANRCILCTRCMRACEEVEGARTWNVMGRGINSMMVTDLNQPWGQSLSCTSCSKCVHVCPTGALSEKNCAVGEMMPRKNVIPYLTSMRYSGR
ncbi:bidirectional hydrogenase complex protein HoxU [Propionivibrio sp.]|uniref:bidirectional hydrogenase complex protein HoxU n=1 Tax=Propionivibrio sp. TaxID=2212460 RepID=UPI0026168BD1|nr:bidirectional hydrogenase complex protein HoxU [Propionivibrio sp.]